MLAAMRAALPSGVPQPDRRHRAVPRPRPAELRRITHLLLAETGERLRAQGITLDVTESAVDWLAEHGHQPELGARPLRRTIARELDRKLSRMIIAGDLGAGQRAVVDVVDGALVLQPRTP